VAQERAVKAKVCAVCFLEKGRKYEEENQSKGVLRAEKGALLSPKGAQVGQDDRTMSNFCIKERKEERKTRGPRGTWKGPYLDP
jgi:hypothetical protein